MIERETLQKIKQDPHPAGYPFPLRPTVPEPANPLWVRMIEGAIALSVKGWHALFPPRPNLTVIEPPERNDLPPAA